MSLFKEVGTTTPQQDLFQPRLAITQQAGSLFKKAGKAAVSLGQASWRGFGSVGAFLAEGPQGIRNPGFPQFTPEGQFQKDLYGTDKPFGSPLEAGFGVLDAIPGGAPAKAGIGMALSAARRAKPLELLTAKELENLRKTFPIDADDYVSNIMPKLQNLRQPKENEALIIHSGDGDWVDTDVLKALNRGVNENTIVDIVPKSSLRTTGTPEKDARGERLIDWNAIKKIPAHDRSTAPNGVSAYYAAKVQPKAEAAFKGFKDITTKIVDDLKGRIRVNKQYLLDATNRPDLKQSERDLIRNLLNDEGPSISAKDFANKVKTELLPLKKRALGADEESPMLRYENISLPDDMRGPIYGYDEVIYDSPISTSAGKTHFGGEAPNYFAHVRREDLADRMLEPGVPDNPTKTRRVIEIQSDLFQKGRLENEGDILDMNPPDGSYSKVTASPERSAELAKLEPYRNTWWERIVREEVKQAANDGKTKLQFPTGETAMKIEGLGTNNSWTMNDRTIPLTADMLKVGRKINQGANIDEWIITDVLGDGKFKAVRKWVYENKELTRGLVQTREEVLANRSETFDISGKVDQNNPIYKFYEKDVQKYLTKKYNAKVVTDERGVQWVEIDIDPKKHRGPVEAFGIGIGAGVAGSQMQTDTSQSTPQR